MMTFAELGLNPTLRENIRHLGYTTPTDIQAKAIGAVLSGADTCMIAPTGTGKTAAYLLPVLQELSRTDHSADEVRPIRAVFLVPTRELAQQLEQSIAGYGKGLKLRAITLFGGIRIESQVKRFKRGADIIVTTPRRLTDLLKIQAFTLDTVQHMVMDEADRLVSMGIGRELQKIWAALPEHKQVVLVSATDSRALKKFSEVHQSAQKYVRADGEQPALDKIAHTMYRCSRQNKSRSLFKLLTMLDCEQALIFTRTRHDVDLLTQRLNEQGFASQGIHNEVPRRERQERLSGFKNREFKFLVATDIASRGIDIDGLYYVINYDLPVNSNDYIHRVGRTARASSGSQRRAASAPVRQAPAKQWRSRGQSGPTAAQGTPASSPWAHAHAGNTAVPDIRGHAFSLVSPEQERLVGAIVKIVGKHISLEKNPFAR